MNISVENISSVDKKIIIEADDSDLKPRIDKALRKYSKDMDLPGFRPGKAPLGLVRKRIGKEVENEQVEALVQEAFQEEIIPKHQPVGEPRMTSMDYTDGQLKAEIMIGVKPEYELPELGELEVDKLVHDVTDEEVEKEYKATIERSYDWKEVEAAATETSKVTADFVKLDADGNETEDKDENVELDLNEEANKVYVEALSGTAPGESTTVELPGENEGETERYKAEIKKVEEKQEPELNEEFFKEKSRGEASDEESFKSFLKSQIQNYFDQQADELLQDRLVTSLIDSVDFEVPQNILDDVVSGRIEKIRQENNGELPEDFDAEAYKKENEESIKKEGKWTFIVSDLFEKFPDTEINESDVDEFFQAEAAKMGLPADMLKNFYASQSEQLEQLRMRIRTNKLFAKLAEEVNINELSRD
ncbi:MAG: trigger factor, partial [Cyclonatronaceae bacterium]